MRTDTPQRYEFIIVEDMHGRVGTGTQADIDELQALIDSLKKLTDVEYLNPTLSQSGRTIYDLTGRRVEKAKKGLYIINGKKVLVK